MTDFINYSEKSEFFLLKKYLEDIQNNCAEFNNCKGIIIRGECGIGKTTFVKRALNTLNYDIIDYDHTLSGSKNIENLFQKQSSKHSIINIFNKKNTKIVILIDNLECINKNERGTMSEILKYTRGKKTKSQKKEEYSLNPVICISNKGYEKKINDLSSKIYTINYEPISNEIIKNILIIEKNIFNNIVHDTLLNNIISFINYNLYELNNIIKLDNIETIKKFMNQVNCLYVTKDVVYKIIQNNLTIEYHNQINETDRTSISLLYHENIIDSVKSLDSKTYINCLSNFCYADYIDRITFQKQIWTFNEMSSLIKIMNNNYILKDYKKKIKKIFVLLKF